MSTRQRLTLSSRLESEVARNIPNSQLKALVDTYREKMAQADELLFECHELKAKIRAITGDKSRAPDVTVYRVRETKVRSFTRQSYVAMRINR